MSERMLMEDWALHAYADGELDAAGRGEIEALLARDPAARADVAAWQRQKDAIRQAYAGVLSEPVPPAIRAVLAGSRRRGWSFGWPTALAASLAFLLIGGAAGWWLAPAPPSLAQYALGAHAIYAGDTARPIELAAADKTELAAWFSNRLGRDMEIPDLTADGFNLLGGRLVPVADRPTALLMYEDAMKRRLTVFVEASGGEGEAPVQVLERNGLIACYWRDGALAFAIAGPLPRDAMMTLAKSVYDAFDKKPA
jgi:anti-sigma factor RsiW